jgi:hypothetical protein
MVRKTVMDTGEFVNGEYLESGAKVPRMILCCIVVISATNSRVIKTANSLQIALLIKKMLPTVLKKRNVTLCA